MLKGHTILKFLRKVHLYAGIFTTPALIFFAITGALQTFSLHETTPGSNYKPPVWIASLAQLHKKQTTVVPVRRIRPALSEGAQAGRQRDETENRGAGRKAGAGEDTAKSVISAPVVPAAQKNHLPMKVFFLLVSVSLLTSTLTGIYLSYKYSRGRWVLTGLLVAGVVVPFALLPF